MALYTMIIDAARITGTQAQQHSCITDAASFLGHSPALGASLFPSRKKSAVNLFFVPMPPQPAQQAVSFALSGVAYIHHDLVLRADNASNGRVTASKICLRPFGGKDL